MAAPPAACLLIPVARRSAPHADRLRPAGDSCRPSLNIAGIINVIGVSMYVHMCAHAHAAGAEHSRHVGPRDQTGVFVLV